MFDRVREDWRTYDGDLNRQGLWVMLVYRYGQWRYRVRPRVLRLPLSITYKFLKVLSQILTGIDLPCEAKVGRRFTIEHFGGIVISGDTQFGDDCVIRNGVTVGLKHTGIRGAPTIGNRVDIGTGAKILGPITIGDDVAIGANAVVVKDVPSNSIAVGVPARIIARATVSSNASNTVARCEATSGNGGSPFTETARIPDGVNVDASTPSGLGERPVESTAEAPLHGPDLIRAALGNQMSGSNPTPINEPTPLVATPSKVASS